MNIKLLLTATLLSCCLPNLSAQDILWEKSYGGKHADYLLDAQPTADYGFILAGSSLSGKTGNKTEDNSGDLDYWIWKMDESGELDWQKSIGGSGADMLYSIRNTKDGGFILAGTSESQSGIHKKDSCRGKEDIWIVKLNAKGGEEWEKTIGGGGHDMVKSIIPTTDGGYIIGGSSSSQISEIILKGGDDPYGKTEESRGGLDFWVIKLDNKGKIQWQHTYGGEYVDMLESISQTTDGGYIIGGYTNSASSINKSEEGYGEGDYWVIKLDKEGTVEWEKVYGGGLDDHLYSLSQTKVGGYIIGGNSASEASGNKKRSNTNGTDIWILKIDENGVITWQQTYNIGKVDILTSLLENADGTFLVGGYAQTEIMETAKKEKKEINDYAAIKLSVDGEELWRKIVGSSGEDVLKKLIETRDGGYIMAGTSKGEISRDRNSRKGSNDFWVVKLQDKQKKENPKKKTQLEAIPNPAIEFTNIIVGFEFTSGTATLFDLAGRQLQSFPVTTRTIPLEMGSYPEGVYVVEVKTDKGTNSVKVLKGKTR